jgi:glutathione S-transferase
MKLYDFALAPNPRRVRMFLAEKGVEVPSVQVNTREREQFSGAFRAINPNCQVPALELDDGTIITESVAICRYFEETHPEPPLIGRDTVDRAIVEMWNRRVEFDGYLAVAEAVRNSLPMFEDRALSGVPGGVPQIPALAERGKATFGRFLTRIDDRRWHGQIAARPRRPSRIMRIFSSAEYCLRVLLRMSRTAFSAADFVLMDLCLMRDRSKGQAELQARTMPLGSFLPSRGVSIAQPSLG